MRVFFTDNWDELERELRKEGKVIFIKNVKSIKSKVKVSIGNSTIDVDLKDVLEFLANLGYDFVGLDANLDDTNFINSIKFIKKANTVEEVLKLEDFETLNSLIKKVKENEFLFATDIAEYLVEKGHSYRELSWRKGDWF